MDNIFKKPIPIMGIFHRGTVIIITAMVLATQPAAGKEFHGKYIRFQYPEECILTRHSGTVDRFELKCPHGWMSLVVMDISFNRITGPIILYQVEKAFKSYLTKEEKSSIVTVKDLKQIINVSNMKKNARVKALRYREKGKEYWKYITLFGHRGKTYLFMRTCEVKRKGLLLDIEKTFTILNK
jgi:hypothetical protein